MRAIFGIGNPGREYENTRHNAGFDILDRFAEKHSLIFKPSKDDYYLAGGSIGTTSFYLIKPTTYVNRSGLAVLDFFEKHDIEPEDLLVVADDINLDLGKIRIRKSGGDGGHNGIASIIYHLNTDQFPRLRFGIGSDFQKGEMATYVLDKFDSDTLTSLEPKLNFAVELIEEYLKEGILPMLNYFSRYAVSIDDMSTNSSIVEDQE